MQRILILITLVLLGLSSAAAQGNTGGDRLKGVWAPSNGRAYVKVDKIGNKYYGRIVWLKEPNDPETGEPKLDKNNPDESMRDTPLKGYRMLKDFVYDEEDEEWTKGTIYDPLSGTLYNCVIRMTDENTLEIRGYVGVEALGRTDIWKRLKKKG